MILFNLLFPAIVLGVVYGLETQSIKQGMVVGFTVVIMEIVFVILILFGML